MSALPFYIAPVPGKFEIPAPRELPDYLPARMVNEFVYCPRLFFYEWVEGVFRESADTIEGAAQHKRVDARPTALPTPAPEGSTGAGDDENSCQIRDAFERTAPGHREARPGGSSGPDRDASGL